MPVLVPQGFNTDPDENGDILIYPEGDKSVPPSGRMPKGGVTILTPFLVSNPWMTNI